MRVAAQEQEVGRFADRERSGAEQRRAGAGRHFPRLGGADRGGVGAGVALGEREHLEVGEQVERVVGAGPVGAEADRDAGLSRLRVGEDAPHGELHVGDRIGDDGAAARGDQLQLLAVEPDAVGENRALAEQPEPVEVGGGADAVGGDAVAHLLLGLGEVDVDRQPALGGDLRGPAQQRLAGDVDRVRGERRPDPERLELLLQAEVLDRRRLDLGDLLAEPEERPADRRPQARVADRARGRLRVPVHVPEVARPGADHLDAGEPRAPVDVLGLELRLDRPDLLLQPAHQRQVAAVAAEERHRRVRVPVDERRDQGGAGGGDQLVAGLGPAHLRAERDDPAALAAQADPLALERGFEDGEARRGAHCQLRQQRLEGVAEARRRSRRGRPRAPRR